MVIDALSLEANVSGKQWNSKLNQTATEGHLNRDDTVNRMFRKQFSNIRDIWVVR